MWQWLALNSCYSNLCVNGTWRFLIMVLAHFKRAPNLHFSPKTPHFGPKMLFKHFSEDFRKFRIFKIFRLWGIPGSENIFLGARRFSAAWKSAHFFTLRGIPGPLRQISKICSTVTSPWDPSTALFWNFWKILRNAACKENTRKKIFFGSGDSPKSKKFENS